MEELSVGSCSDLVNDRRFQIKEDTSWHMLSSSGFGEEGVEGIITSSDCLIGGHLTVRLNAVLKAEQFPTGVTDLNTSLTNVDRDNFSHSYLI